MNNNKEDLIKEQRISEAMINGYIGQNGKFAYILKWLGFPIIEQNITSDNYEFLNYEFNEKSDEILELSEDTNAHEIGYYFDGLKYGFNLNMKYDNLSKEITVIYDGKIVYKEDNGDLMSYVPNQKWENDIKNLCDIAKKIETRKKSIINDELKRQIKDKKQSIYKDLKEKWGI